MIRVNWKEWSVDTSICIREGWEGKCCYFNKNATYKKIQLRWDERLEIEGINMNFIPQNILWEEKCLSCWTATSSQVSQNSCCTITMTFKQILWKGMNPSYPETSCVINCTTNSFTRMTLALKYLWWLICH